MVAPKRGRGARNQAAKGKATPVEEPQQVAPEAEPAAEEAPAEENNGDSELMEQSEDAAAGGDANVSADAPTDGDAEPGAEPEPEKKEEEKVESGKLLVENLPSSYLFDYQEKLKELFSKYGEVIAVKRGPIIVTELTTTPTLSAIVEFKNKESLDKALCEDGAVVEGRALTVAVESRAETAVLVGVPYEASSDYVRLLFAQCGPVAHIHEFSKTKYKILRVTFHEKESVELALKLDRELRINGFLVTVSKYRDDDEQKAHNANNNKNKRQHSQQQNRNNSNNANVNTNASPNANRNNAYRPRGGGGGGGGAGAFSARGNFRGDTRNIYSGFDATIINNGEGARGRGGFGGRGGSFPRGGFPPVNSYMPPQAFMGPGRPGGFMDGQRPNKRLRQM